jgi:uncharacterized membrane protein YdjX (TVP38/TMEM64 family)
MRSSNLSSDERGHVVRWIILAAAVLLVGLLVFSPQVKHFVNAANAWATEVMNGYPVLGALVFFLFSAFSAMFAFASSTVLVPPAELVWGRPLTFFLLWGGWMTGAIAAFGIGRLARPLLSNSFEEKVKKYEQFVSHRMKFWAVLLCCFAIPSEVPGYLFGSMHYPFVKFVAANAIAESAYALGVVVAGESLLRDDPLPFFAAISLLIIAAVAAGWLLRALRKRKAADLSPR